MTSTTEKPIFERKTEAEGQVEVEFFIKFADTEEKRFLEFTARGTRPNQLFLTESIDRNIKRFEDVFDWFDKTLVTIFPETPAVGSQVVYKMNEDFREFFQKVLQLLDIGISRIELKEYDFDDEANIPLPIKERIKDELQKSETKDRQTIIQAPNGESYFIHLDERGQIKVSKFMTAHKANNANGETLFEVSEESDGTQRLFHIIPILVGLIKGEHVYVIDELDRSLHPHLSRSFLELFLNTETKQTSQLIVTTHESSLLDLELLRRDEIWFLEKNQDGASVLYSLEEFAPRYDKDIRKGYLLGRFGAIPVIQKHPDLELLKE